MAGEAKTMLKRGKKMREEGFSLIEVMIAASILVVGLLAILGLQVAGTDQLALARHKTVALQLASQQIELLKSLPFNPADPLTPICCDMNGNLYVDANGESILADIVNGIYPETSGDGQPTWHWYEAVTSTGQVVSGSVPPGEMVYLMMWSVEWGGELGTPVDALPNRIADKIYPRQHQILIQVWVGWYERDENESVLGFWSGFTPSGELRQFDYTNPFPRHRVVLSTIRDIY